MDLDCGRYWFKSHSIAENSNKFQKAKFWKENSIDNVVTRGPIAHATLIVFKIEF